MNNKNKTLSIKEKYEIIKLRTNRTPNKDIMKKFGLKNSSNISMILKQKDKIINAFEANNYLSNRKKNKSQ